MSIITNTNSLIIGRQYKITPPIYDENDIHEIDLVEVLSKDKNRGHYIFKYIGIYEDDKVINLETPFTLSKSYSDLSDYIIENID